MNEFDTVEVESKPEFQQPEGSESEKGFPKWRYGPDGQSAIFQSAKDVPSGWYDHPSKVKGAPDPSLVVAEPRRPGKAGIMKELKRKNIPFNPMTPASTLWAILQEAAAAPEKASEAPAAKKPQSPLSALRKEYKALSGKNPSPRLDAEALGEKIAALKG